MIQIHNCMTITVNFLKKIVVITLKVEQDGISLE